MRIGILTAGGDCPGLNAVIRGVVARANERHDAVVVGVLDGWDGLMEGRVRPLDREAVRGILQRGGTILGTSRRDPYVHGEGAASVRTTLEREHLDGLVVVGGDGTLRSALRLSEEGIPIVGVRLDFRPSGDNEATVVNLQVAHFIEASGGCIVRALADAVAALVALLLKPE